MVDKYFWRSLLRSIKNGNFYLSYLYGSFVPTLTPKTENLGHGEFYREVSASNRQI